MLVIFNPAKKYASYEAARLASNRVVARLDTKSSVLSRGVYQSEEGFGFEILAEGDTDDLGGLRQRRSIPEFRTERAFSGAFLSLEGKTLTYAKKRLRMAFERFFDLPPIWLPPALREFAYPNVFSILDRTAQNAGRIHAHMPRDAFFLLSLNRLMGNPATFKRMIGEPREYQDRKHDYEYLVERCVSVLNGQGALSQEISTKPYRLQNSQRPVEPYFRAASARLIELSADIPPYSLPRSIDLKNNSIPKWIQHQLRNDISGFTVNQQLRNIPLQCATTFIRAGLCDSAAAAEIWFERLYQSISSKIPPLSFLGREEGARNTGRRVTVPFRRIDLMQTLLGLNFFEYRYNRTKKRYTCWRPTTTTHPVYYHVTPQETLRCRLEASKDMLDFIEQNNEKNS